MNRLPETTYKHGRLQLDENDQSNEMCNECGQSVRAGSGKFVNRVIDSGGDKTRTEMGKPHPEGDYMCAECEAEQDEQPGEVLQFPVQAGKRSVKMDCKLCGSHILATMQIIWGGYPYHPDCIGEAVARKRAEGEQRLGTIESFEEEFPGGINEDDFDEFEDYENQEIEEEIEDFPDVSDDVLAQIPISKSNGRVVPEVVEPLRREVHINDVVATAAREFVAQRSNGKGSVGTLIAGNTTTLINRSALKHLPMPEATATHQPIAHHSLVEQIHECLSYRRLSVVREEYAVSPDGMKMFGLLELNVEYSGVRFAIGLRNSNDKSMRIGLVAGYRVTVCENKMLTGDFNPLSAKHSKNFNLIDALSVGVDRIQRNIGRVEENIEFKKNYWLDEESARNMIYRAFLIDKFPMSLMRSVHHEFFVAPSYEEFKSKTLWSLENSFTSVFKKLKPVAQFEATARLGL